MKSVKVSRIALFAGTTLCALAAGTTQAAPPTPSTWNIQGTVVPGAPWSMAQPWETLQASGASCSTPGTILATPYSGGGGAWVGRGSPGSLNLPLVFRAASSSTLANQGMVISAGQIGLHPSGTDCAVLRFKAPADGIYQVNGEFFAPVDSQTKHPNNVVGRVLAKGVQVTSGTVDLPAGVNHWTIPAQTVALQTGETIDFAVDNGGNGFGSDTVLLDGTVKWVDDLPPPANQFTAADFDFEGMQGCALEKGTMALFCWGDNGDKQLGKNGAATNSDVAVPAARITSYMTNNNLGGIHALQVASNAVCVRSTTGKTLCWGNNQGFQTTATSGTNTNSQNPPFALVDATSAVGPYQTFQFDAATGCGIHAGGSVRCWGQNIYNGLSSIGGQLGHANQQAPLHVSSPSALAPVPLIAGARAVSTSGAYSCAIVGPQSQVMCWGKTAWGSQVMGGGHPATTLAGGTVYTQTVKTALNTDLTGVTAIEVRGTRGCANKGGTLYCWGMNNLAGALLGAPMSIASNVVEFAIPMSGPFASGVTAFALAGNSICAVRGPGALVYCQGKNPEGELGKTPVGNQWRTFTASYAGGAVTHDVTPVPGISGIQKIRGGTAGYCARDANSAIWCWGDDSKGQLGDGNGFADSAAPVRVTK